MRQQLLKASKILQNNEGIDGKELGKKFFAHIFCYMELKVPYNKVIRSIKIDFINNPLSKKVKIL